MSTMVRGQEVQGIEIGAGWPLAILVFAISVAFVGMNGYHMSNYLIAKLTTFESGLMTVAWWKVVGFGVAALEIPLGMSFITNYRLYGIWHSGVIFQLAFAMTVAALAAGAGIGSQLADAESRSNQITSHNTAIGAYQYSANAAKANRDKRVLAADLIRDDNQRAIAKLNAEQKYQQALANIAQNTSSKQAKKPLKIMEDGGRLQLIVFGLLSIVASLGAFFLSCFHAVYIKQLVALIAFSLKSKANHDWESQASDFKTRKHELSPLNKDKGILFKEKVPAETVKHEPALSPEELEKTFKSSQKEEEKSREKVHVQCPACDTVFSAEKRLMVPSAKNRKGQLRCGECQSTFYGVANIVTSNEASATEKTDNTKPANQTLNNPEKPTIETPNAVSGNSQDSEISEKFAGNSREIRLEKQAVTSAANSTEIPQKFAANSTEISGGANSQGNSQELMPRKSDKSQHIDLSGVAKIDGAEEKLKALADTIDTLSADPKADGLRFSPTKTFKQLHLNYGRVQKVFQDKQSEGKISMTKPYKIIYREGV